ncbi:MAG: hypothetical protein ACJ72Z_06605 [Pyrinomonadaceae bacterium]
MKPRIALCLMLLVSASLAAFSQNSSPLAAVNAFYKFDRSHSQLFNRANIDAREQWFSAGLYKLLINELVREKEYLKKNPTDKPHFGDGLPFQPLDEECTAGTKKYRNTLSFGPINVNGSSRNFDAYFSYPKACGIEKTTFEIVVIKQNGKWVIDDVLYPATTSTLVEDLNRKEY